MEDIRKSIMADVEDMVKGIKKDIKDIEEDKFDSDEFWDEVCEQEVRQAMNECY